MRTVDEMYKDGRVVADIAGAGAHQDEFGNITSDPVLPHASLRWSSFNTQWPVWNRDFLFVQYVDRGEFEGRRYGVVLSLSVERRDVPNLEASHSFVRGSVLGSGYVALENPDGSLQITYLVRVDAAGAIPGKAFWRLSVRVLELSRAPSSFQRGILWRCVRSLAAEHCCAGARIERVANACSVRREALCGIHFGPQSGVDYGPSAAACECVLLQGYKVDSPGVPLAAATPRSRFLHPLSPVHR
jgi:hypothetical protein